MYTAVTHHNASMNDNLNCQKPEQSWLQSIKKTHSGKVLNGLKNILGDF